MAAKQFPPMFDGSRTYAKHMPIEGIMRTFDSAQWIWCGTMNVDVVNAWMQARRLFVLRRRPKSAEICVTADARYVLYVNGRFVCRGPARGYQKAWPFDRVDIALYLRRGRNVVAALVHSFGVHTFQYLHQGWAGFILAGKISGVDISTGPDWRVRCAPAYRRVLARLSAQQGFQEFFDARLDDGLWTTITYDDNQWDKPVCFPPYQEPWPNFEERGIPLLAEKIVIPCRLAAISTGKSTVDVAGADDVVKLFCAERRRWHVPDMSKIDVDGRRTNQWFAFSAQGVGKSGFVSYCLDFGEEIIGCVRIAAEGAQGGEIVDCIGCETMRTGVPLILHPHACGDRMAIGSRLILQRGGCQHEFFAPWGLRYLVVTIRNAKRNFTLKAALKRISYPVPQKEFFKCSDPELNRIFEICLRTQQCCMLDAYVDCPWREQVQWGDASIQALSGFPLTGSADLFRRYLRQIGMQTNPDGLVYALAPSDGYNHIIPNYTFTWITSFWDYYLQTGDLALFREMEPVVRRNFDFYWRWRAANGLLLPPRARWFWFVLSAAPDFAKGERGFSALFNLQCLGALQALARLYRLLCHPLGGVYAQKATAFGKTIVRQLFDRQQQYFCGGISESGRLVRHVVVKGQRFEGDPFSAACAILCGILPEMHLCFADQIEGLLRDLPPGRGGPHIAAMHLLFEALKKVGRNEAVIKFIRAWWRRGVIEQGLTTTPEDWGRCNDGHSSNCHAYGAYPILHFFNIILGVQPVSPGWRKLRVTLCHCDLDWARGCIVTPAGPVEIEWRRDGHAIAGRIAAPEGVKILRHLRGKLFRTTAG